MGLGKIQSHVQTALSDLLKSFPMDNRHILVMGVSTSEVLGQHIGSSGSEDVAKEIYDAVIETKNKFGLHIAFQGCEHINRALVVERETVEKFALEIVSVVPAKNAGGAMATYVFSQMKDPVVVEFIKADAGIDIGNTLIGMHLKHVAVPVRPTIKKIKNANLTMAKTRPKLIGGIRAQYSLEVKESVSTINEIDDRSDESC